MIGLSKWRVIDNKNPWVGFYEERIESGIFKSSHREKSIVQERLIILKLIYCLIQFKKTNIIFLPRK